MRGLLPLLALLALVNSVASARLSPGAEESERAAVTALVQRAAAAAAASTAGRPGPRAYKRTEPIIGVLTQPCSDCPGKSYIASSYVHWVEAAGGRVAPIRFYASDRELHRLFKSGGLTWLWLDSPYVGAARKLFNWAVQENDAGNPFPIHGTCLGHQLLHILVSNVSRNDLLVETDAVSHPSTLEFTSAADDSRTWGNLPADLRSKLEDPKLNIAMQNHEYGIPPSHYKRWPILGNFFNILTTTKDRNGLEYISTVEAKKYPFVGVQWHPEKPTSEFGNNDIPHTLDAVRVGQHLANNFVDTARYSDHAPDSHEQELADLIYSTAPVFSARFEDKPPSGPDDDEHEGGGDPDPASAARARRRGEDGPRLVKSS
ncbi:gamma-glutamyl hydrolase [Raphidocelis subcapitata]|uniref:folate gamma-glutamyl hydrolase n=1 Tax=Raphidocelis subcapitata TaxID=307507 RepID=A0A2V0PFX6_9CHLO|nr:gamma-glutamyl hydrolase [Raphidocelis subcapitata]|eukprot:GBF96107.1 gamma-glutamyl hydrolase [Raphidocelis subcapitata]